MFKLEETSTNKYNNSDETLQSSLFPKVSRCMMLFCIHKMNRVNSAVLLLGELMMQPRQSAGRGTPPPIHSLLAVFGVSIIWTPWKILDLPLVWVLAIALLNTVMTSRSSQSWKWQLIGMTGWRPSVVDWGGGMSVCCTAGPIVRYRGQWMAA